MSGKVARNRMGIFFVAGQAQRQRFDAALEQEAVERIEDAAQGLRVELELFVELVVIEDDEPGEKVGMTAVIFSGRIDDHVGAEVERTLIDAREERIVDGEQPAAGFGSFGHMSNIGDFEERIRGRFDVDELDVSGRRFKVVGIEVVDHRELDAALLKELGRIKPGAAVDVVGDQHAVAGIERFKDQRNRGHAGGSGDAVLGALNVGSMLFNVRTRRIGCAAVAVFAELRRPLLDKGRGEINGECGSVVGSVGETAVNGNGRDLHDDGPGRQ